MPGSPLAIQYPVTGDSTKDVLTKFSDNFQVLETDLEAKVTQADIEIGGALEMHDHPLTEVGSLLMTDNIGASAVAGTLMYATGKWYVADGVGAIQLTDGAGGINAAGISGIGGDYGGGNPAAVTFSDIDSSYSFTTDPGVYASLNALSITFQTAAGSLTLEPDAAIAGAKTITISEPPASGTGMLTLTSTGVMEANAAVTTAQTFADVTVTVLRRPAQAKAIPVHLFTPTTTSTVYRNVTPTVALTATTAACEVVAPIELDIGEAVSSVTAYAFRSGAGTMTIELFKCDTAGVTTSVASNTSVATGPVTITATDASPTACAAGESYYVRIVFPSPVFTDILRAAFYTRSSL